MYYYFFSLFFTFTFIYFYFSFLLLFTFTLVFHFYFYVKFHFYFHSTFVCLPTPINRKFTKFQIENSQLARWSQFQSNLFKTIRGKVQKLTKHPSKQGLFCVLVTIPPLPPLYLCWGSSSPSFPPSLFGELLSWDKNPCHVSNIPSSASMSTTIFSLFGELIF